MLTLKVVSDQHLEFRLIGGAYLKYFNRIHPQVGERADACVVAGDLDTIWPRSRMFFQLLCEREIQVIYVPSNHEYYGARSMIAVDDMLRTIENECSNLKVLRTGEVFSYRGTRFLGDTMWVPRTESLIASASQMNDPKQVLALRPQDRDQTQKRVEQLDEALEVLTRLDASAEARKRIAAAQRARWAKWKRAQREIKPPGQYCQRIHRHSFCLQTTWIQYRRSPGAFPVGDASQCERNCSLTPTGLVPLRSHHRREVH